MSGNCTYIAIFWFIGLACLAGTCKNIVDLCGEEEALLDKEFG
jgi:hypothetical protein